uniref:Uncharacterized protein n=1 Tax=Siphoviridae sp. ctmpG14 TaxID=2825654 RepID=A0A8S5PAY2_9CAUD|nr:MAG TPA: hypothetical protein [Siphoviridae sp. ctmpG14]
MGSSKVTFKCNSDTILLSSRLHTFSVIKKFSLCNQLLNSLC